MAAVIRSGTRQKIYKRKQNDDENGEKKIFFFDEKLLFNVILIENIMILLLLLSAEYFSILLHIPCMVETTHIVCRHVLQS